METVKEVDRETGTGVETEEGAFNDEGGDTGNDEDKGEPISDENKKAEDIKPVPKKSSGKTNTTLAEKVHKKAEAVVG